MKLGKWGALPSFLLNSLLQRASFFLFGACLFFDIISTPSSALNSHPFPVFGGPDVFIPRPILVTDVCGEIAMSLSGLLLQNILHRNETWYLVSHLYSPPKRHICFWLLVRVVLENSVFHKGINWGLASLFKPWDAVHIQWIILAGPQRCS